MAPTAADFRAELDKLLLEAKQAGKKAVEVTAGELHRRVGGYPGTNHRIPMACGAMRQASGSGDVELPNNLKKDGASFAIRYSLPR